MENPFGRFFANVRTLVRMRRSKQEAGAQETAADDDIFAKPPTFAELLARAKAKAIATDSPQHKPRGAGETCKECAVLGKEWHVDIRSLGEFPCFGSLASWVGMGMYWLGNGSYAYQWPLLAAAPFVIIGWISSMRWCGWSASPEMDWIGRFMGSLLVLALYVPFVFFYSCYVAFHRLITHPFRALRHWWRSRKETCARCKDWMPVLGDADNRQEITPMVAVIWGASPLAGLVLYVLKETPLLAGHPAMVVPGSISVIFMLVGCVAVLVDVAIAPRLLALSVPLRLLRRLFHRHGATTQVRAPGLDEHATETSEQTLVEQYLLELMEEERERWCGTESSYARAHALLKEELGRIQKLITACEHKIVAAREAGRSAREVVTIGKERLVERQTQLNHRMGLLDTCITEAREQFGECEALIERFAEPMDDKVLAREISAALSRSDDLLTMADSVLEVTTEAFCTRMAQIRTALSGALADAEFDTALAAASGDHREIAALEAAAERLRPLRERMEEAIRPAIRPTQDIAR